MKKKIALIITIIMLSTSTVLSCQIEKENKSDTLEDDKAINGRVWVMAIPKIVRAGRPTLLIILCPMFLSNGLIHYDFNDGTFHDGENMVKHKFFDSGTYKIDIEFDNKFGGVTTGSTRVFVI